MDDKVILITGGTGSFGKKFTEIMLQDYRPKKLIIFSRHELKQHEMRQVYPDTSDTVLPNCAPRSCLCKAIPTPVFTALASVARPTRMRRQPGACGSGVSRKSSEIAVTDSRMTIILDSVALAHVESPNLTGGSTLMTYVS